MTWAIENIDQPEKPDKGLRGGSCNRRACQAPGATWYNRSTRAHYCGECAALLNRVNRRDSVRIYGGPLCVPGGASDE